jgi:histidinol-phosphatase
LSDREIRGGPPAGHASVFPVGVPSATAGDLELAHELADRAAVVALSYFGSDDLVTEIKEDASPVTVADRAVEVLLREGLSAMRPDDAIVGEVLGTSGSSSRRWVLDPIDGTNLFAEGSPEWRIQLALEDDGEVIVALVDMPAAGIRWWATRGGGTFERGADGAVSRLSVSTVSAVSRAVVTCFPDSISDRLPVDAELRSWRRLSLPEVIRGDIEAFYVDCCQIWDHAPWVLLVEEAGGRFTDHEGGRSPAKRGGLYSNGAVHDALLRAIAGS